MKILSSVFEISASALRSCPPASMPEFAFIGRSNVGKSTLINLLAERKELAMVSAQPGKTRLINFFVVNGQWRLVDLPGYGFAKGAKAERAEFNVSVADYLEKRPSLLRTFVLIDSQLPPQKIDLDFIGWLAGCGVDYTLIFTKTDKQPGQVQAAIARFKKTLQGLEIDPPACFACSALTKKGRNEILDFIEQTLAAGFPGSAAPAKPQKPAPANPDVAEADASGSEVW
jgi:GTP-binding protein